MATSPDINKINSSSKINKAGTNNTGIMSLFSTTFAKNNNTKRNDNDIIMGLHQPTNSLQIGANNGRRGSFDLNETRRKRPLPVEENEINTPANKKTKIINQENINDNISEIESKEVEELNDENIWKKNKKIRREYFCKSTLTLVITPVNGNLLKSQTAVLKLFGKNTKAISSKLKAHTFSSTLRTIYIHLQRNVRREEAEEFIKRYNSLQQEQEMKENNDENENKKPRKVSRCSFFNSNYVNEQKEKRIQQVQNPEENKTVLLKNVPLRETEEEIKETLTELEYNIEKVERFKRLPIVKVTFGTSQDVQRIIQDQNIRIGYNLVKCEIFDKFRSRPRSHFHQCRNCFGLNHFAKDCNRRKKCKYCGGINHSSQNCYHKGNSEKQKCILCKGNHPSDSILCPVIQQTRETIGINLSRREKIIIQRKENIHVEQNQKKTVILQKNSSQASVKAWKDLASNRNEELNNERKQKVEKEQEQKISQPIPSKNKTQQQRQRNNNQYQSYNQQDEILQLRKEISELRSTVKDLMETVRALTPLLKIASSNYEENTKLETIPMEYDQ